MLGPLAAGACLARVGPAACYAVMALMYGCGLAACTGLAAKLGAPRATVPGSVAASMRAGLQAAWASGTVRAVLLVTIAMNTLFFPYQHMLPVFARDVLAVGPFALGALVAVDGLGALTGALAIASGGGRLDHRMVFGSAVMIAPLLLGRARRLPLARRLRRHPGRHGCRRVRLRHHAEHARPSLRPRTPPRRRHGHPLRCIGTQSFGTLAIGLLAATSAPPALSPSTPPSPSP
jgi:hypothetical protein